MGRSLAFYCAMPWELQAAVSLRSIAIILIAEKVIEEWWMCTLYCILKMKNDNRCDADDISFFCLYVDECTRRGVLFILGDDAYTTQNITYRTREQFCDNKK